METMFLNLGFISNADIVAKAIARIVLIKKNSYKTHYTQK
jgi:hypothetical protein